MNALAIREKVQAMSRPQQLLLGVGVVGGATLLALAFTQRKTIMDVTSKGFDFAKAQAFKLALPAAVAQYASQILIAAQKYNVDPWALAAIMWNESRGGTAAPHYRPTGPGGTGDWTPRFDPKLGKTSSTGWQHANPATGLPPDGLGWGRGLMQIDYGVHIDWFKSGANWRDAQTNINKGAELLAEKFRFFKAVPKPGTMVPVESWRVTTGKPQYGILPWATKYPRAGAWPTSVPDPRPLSGARLFEASIAAYNVSYTAVLQAIGLGLPAEAGTAHQSYVTKFLSMVGDWQKKFS